MDFVEADRGRLGDPDLLRVRPDLLLCELLELLARLPHVGDADPVIGRANPVRETAFGHLMGGIEAHQLHHLVVLLERGALEVHHDADRHLPAPLGWWKKRSASVLRATPDPWITDRRTGPAARPAV